MKLGSVTKLDKRKTATSKKFDNYVMSGNWDIIVFFQFMVNLQPSESQIPETWSIKLTFSLIVTFHLTKPENKTKKFLTQLSYCSIE